MPVQSSIRRHAPLWISILAGIALWEIAGRSTSAAFMPLIFFVTRAPVQIAIVLFSIAFAGQQSWSTLVMILPADIFPRRAVGSVAGLVGFGGAMGGVVFGLVVGYLLDHGFGYGLVFALVSTFHVL